MNWRLIRWIMLILLVALNLGLWGYSRYLNRQMYEVPEERLQALAERYEEAGFLLPESLPYRQYPKSRLLLEAKDPESVADTFFTEDHEKSFMPGGRILYTCGTQTLTVDRDHSQMTYVQNEPLAAQSGEAEADRTKARSFAETVMGTRSLVETRMIELDDGIRVFFFCELYKEEAVFANRAAVTVFGAEVTRATITQYRIKGYEEEEKPIYPIDELLYGCLYRLQSGGDQEQLTLLYGYQLTETGEDILACDPSVCLLREDGTGIMIDQFTDSIRDLS